MSNFYCSSVISGCLATCALALAAACLGTTPARAAAERECYDILSEPTPEFQTYACGKLRDVDVAPRDAVVSGRLACDSAIGVQTRGDMVWVCQNPLSTVNRKAQLSREQAEQPGLDPRTIGTWEIQFAAGPWVLEVLTNGTYTFHSEAQDGVASTAGTFSASNGRWSLRASNSYSDGGTYAFQSHDVWIATGQLGTGVWHRRS
jgi:hypothetical protein